MPKSDPSRPLDGYAPVANRIALFYSTYPEGRITTKLLPARREEIAVKAFVYRRQGDTLPAATGLASERIGDGEVNTYACLENTETSAIGRALANLGFAASDKRPSREEMEKVQRAKGAVSYRSGSTRTGIARAAESAAPAYNDVAAHHDLLLLMDRAEQCGYSPRRLDVLRKRLEANPIIAEPDAIRIENALRGWVLRHARATPA